MRVGLWRKLSTEELMLWTVVLETTLEILWTARRSNQSILKEISPGCSLEGLMLKLKFQYFGHLMWRADSFEKSLMLGKIEGRRRRGRQRMRWLDDITNSMDMSLSNTWLSLSSHMWSWAGVSRAQHPGSQVTTELVDVVHVGQPPRALLKQCMNLKGSV